jgi:dipeptidyl aminopeptidase/acylaminoacyl peptidase
MAAALKHAGKKYEVVTIPRGDHQLAWRSERITLLTAVEKFLAANLPTSDH